MDERNFALSDGRVVWTTYWKFSVPPGDATALARAWQRLLADPDRRAQLGRAGRLSVEKKFGARTMAEHFGRATARFVRPTT